MKLSRALLTSGLVLALTMGSAGPASAAPPANDTYRGRTVITALPFTTTLNTTQARTGPLDAEMNRDCGAPATDASVWYQHRAAANGFLLADVSASNYTAGVIVATGAPGSFQLVACGPGGVIWEAQAGTRYTLLVFDDQFDGGGNGGTLRLTVDTAPPPPTLDLTVNPTGTFTRDGSAILSGTFRCDAGAEGFVEMLVSQWVGRVKIQGFGGTVLECDGTTRPWSVEVTAENGRFAGGKAATVTFAIACNEFLCSDEFLDERTVILKGKAG